MRPYICFTLVPVFFGFLLHSTSFADDGPIWRAIDADSPRALARAMVEAGRSVNDLIDDNILGSRSITMLGYAARAGAVGVTDFLLQHEGIDLNKPNRVGETPLMLAAFFKDWTDGGQPSDSYVLHEKIVRRLVAAGAHIESIGQFSPLAYATYYDHARIVEFLLRSGARPDSDATLEKGASYLTGLMFAASNGGKNSLLVLLKFGANPRIKNSYGYDSLALAKQYKRTQLIPYLHCAYFLEPGETYLDKCGDLP